MTFSSHLIVTSFLPHTKFTIHRFISHHVLLIITISPHPMISQILYGFDSKERSGSNIIALPNSTTDRICHTHSGARFVADPASRPTSATTAVYYSNLSVFFIGRPQGLNCLLVTTPQCRDFHTIIRHLDVLASITKVNTSVGTCSTWNLLVDNRLSHLGG